MLQHIMICISGFSGSGKDEFAKRLVEKHQAIHTGCADPAKRHMADVYGFTEQQLFGPSENRNDGDMRYPKNILMDIEPRPCEENEEIPGVTGSSIGWWRVYLVNDDPKTTDQHVEFVHHIVQNKYSEKFPIAFRSTNDGVSNGTYFYFKEKDPRFWLSPREVLQLYCEKLNTLYVSTWVKKGIEIQKKLITGEYSYSKMLGLVQNFGEKKSSYPVITCFTDFRHIHEFKYARTFTDESTRTVFIRIKRPSVPKPPFSHKSEIEQTFIRDAAFDFVVDNDSTIENLYRRVDNIVKYCTTPWWNQIDWNQSVINTNWNPDSGYQK